jgi:hypothetical protein
MGVEIAVEGKSIPAGRGAYSGNLATAEERQALQRTGAAAAAANEGILLPQYLTPFAGEYPRATPSYVRRGAR